jgi:glycogen(starch) synthase
VRIALITPEYPGCGPSFGVGSYVERLARELTAAGHGVCVAVVAHEGCWLGHSDHVHRVSAQRVPGVVRAWWTSRWLLRTLDDLAPDVVEIPNWGGLGAFIPRHWPVVVRLSTSIEHQRSRDRLRRHLHPFHLRCERATVRHAHVLVANSQAIATASAPLYGRMADRIIPHAFPAPAQTGRPEGADVLFVGRLEHRKGIDVLLRAWPAVHRRCPRSTLHLVGDDHHQLATRLPRPAGVAFHGMLGQAQLTSLRARCAVQVVPSRFESFGLTVVEAFAAGHAVVAGACAGLAETIGPAGLTYAVEDPAALAAALVGVLTDDGLRARLVGLGALRLRERFGLAAWRAATLEAYEAARIRARGIPANALA